MAGRLSINGKSAYGIELNVGSDGQNYWTLVQLKLDAKKEIKIIRQEYFTEPFDAGRLQSLGINRTTPIAFCLSGTGMFIEKLSTAGRKADLTSGMEEDTVYYREYSAATDNNYGCFVRKDTILNHIQPVAAQGYFIWSISIGPLNVLSIAGLLKHPSSKLQLGSYQLSLSPVNVDYGDPTEGITSHSNEPCMVGSSPTNTQMLPALAAAIEFYLDDESHDFDFLTEQRKEYLAYRKAKVFGYSFLALLFLILLINFQVYSGYTSQLQKQQATLSENQRRNAQLELLKKELAEKQGLLATMGIQRQTPISFLADRFAACIPKDMKLTSLAINPLTEKIKNQKPALFKEGTIIAEGECDYPDALNLLIERLRKEPWLLKIEKKEYKEVNFQGYFIIEVSYEQ